MRVTGHNEAKVAALISFCAVLAFAQPQSVPPQQNAQEDVDPDSPNHSAARISVMNGDVSVRRGDNGDFVAAVQGDNFQTFATVTLPTVERGRFMDSVISGATHRRSEEVA